MLTREKAKVYIAGRSLKIGNATGAAQATLNDGDILSFGGQPAEIDELTIQHFNGGPLSVHNMSTNGNDERFFSIQGRDILEVDYDGGNGNTIRIYFVFPVGDVDCFYFYFSESATGTKDLFTLEDPNLNVNIQVNTGLNIQNIVILGDPPMGGPGPKN